MQCMTTWNPGDRVEHPAFGTGTVLEANDQHTIVRFDDRGPKKLASHVAMLTPSNRAAPGASAARAQSSSERTTDVGYVNLNEQVVVRATDLQGNLPGQRVYVLKCVRCGAQYGANGGDIHLRRCPSCMGGQPGLPF